MPNDGMLSRNTVLRTIEILSQNSSGGLKTPGNHEKNKNMLFSVLKRVANTFTTDLQAMVLDAKRAARC